MMIRTITTLLFAALCLLSPLVSSAKGDAEGCDLIFIGNSITYGALHKERIKTAPPVLCAHLLGKRLRSEVSLRNCARSGATTYDFLPDGGRDWPKVAQAMSELKAKGDADKVIIFSIMLGTNDSAAEGPTTGSPVSREQYKRNLLTIIEACRAECPNAIFVLHRPIWYSPNTYNGAVYLAAGLKRMGRYIDALVALDNEFDHIYLGDVDAYPFFEKHHQRFHIPEEGNAGTFYLHPNEAGAKRLAKFWAVAITEAVRKSKQ